LDERPNAAMENKQAAIHLIEIAQFRALILKTSIDMSSRGRSGFDITACLHTTAISSAA